MIVISGAARFYWGSAFADVQPGRTVAAGQFFIKSMDNSEEFGAGNPTWRADSAQLDYIFGGCAGMYQLPTNPPAGMIAQPLLGGSNPQACEMARGPTAALANQILYMTPLFGDNSIYQATEGSADGGVKLISVDSPAEVFDMHWLPDGSGFLFAETTTDLSSSNLYEYNFATQAITQRTNFTNEFAGHFSISPDGQSIVFERAPTIDSPTDLWMMRRDGSDMHLFVQNGQRPSWSQQIPQPERHVYLPLARR